MFENFSHNTVTANGIRINVRHAGSGPPVLLLHGYPQTHAIWHRVAPILAEHFTVVCPDLRGYGDSDKPASDPSHKPYAKRTMALDQLELMRALGHEHFHLVGHDRGARVARRLALDRPDAVDRLVVLDIIPTASIYQQLDQQRATIVWRYFFLTQPPDLPERLIGADPRLYLHATLDEWAGTPDAIRAEALTEYERCFTPAAIHASCEDYRAGATIDLAHDRADRHQPICAPLLLLWSRKGIGAQYDVLHIWKQQAAHADGHPLDCGHFLPEEQPDQIAAELRQWMNA